MNHTLMENDDQSLWKDRKRILGMPITFTRYEVTNDRLVTNKGLLHSETNELLLYRILDIRMRRSLWQKIFGVGTIILYCADKSDSTYELQSVKKPDSVRKFLSKIVEQQRTQKGITGRELYGAAAGMMQDPGEAAPMQQFADIDGDGIPD